MSDSKILPNIGSRFNSEKGHFGGYRLIIGGNSVGPENNSFKLNIK